MRPGRFDAVEVRCVTRDELCELYKRATQAVPATFEMPKKLSLPRMPGVEESLLGLLSAQELVTKVLTDPTGHIRPARYHLMAALRWQVLGPDRLSANPRRAAEQCRRLADLIWDPGAAERAVLKLLPTFQRIMAAESSAGVPPGEMVRNRRFAEAVRTAVLPAQRRNSGSNTVASAG